MGNACGKRFFLNPEEYYRQKFEEAAAAKKQEVAQNQAADSEEEDDGESELHGAGCGSGGACGAVRGFLAAAGKTKKELVCPAVSESDSDSDCDDTTIPRKLGKNGVNSIDLIDWESLKTVTKKSRGELDKFDEITMRTLNDPPQRQHLEWRRWKETVYLWALALRKVRASFTKMGQMVLSKSFAGHEGEYNMAVSASASRDLISIMHHLDTKFSIPVRTIIEKCEEIIPKIIRLDGQSPVMFLQLLNLVFIRGQDFNKNQRSEHNKVMRGLSALRLEHNTEQLIKSKLPAEVDEMEFMQLENLVDTLGVKDTTRHDTGGKKHEPNKSGEKDWIVELMVAMGERLRGDASSHNTHMNNYFNAGSRTGPAGTVHLADGGVGGLNPGGQIGGGQVNNITAQPGLQPNGQVKDDRATLRGKDKAYWDKLKLVAPSQKDAKLKARKEMLSAQNNTDGYWCEFGDWCESVPRTGDCIGRHSGPEFGRLIRRFEDEHPEEYKVWKVKQAEIKKEKLKQKQKSKKGAAAGSSGGNIGSGKSKSTGLRETLLPPDDEFADGDGKRTIEQENSKSTTQTELPLLADSNIDAAGRLTHDVQAYNKRIPSSSSHDYDFWQKPSQKRIKFADTTAQSRSGTTSDIEMDLSQGNGGAELADLNQKLLQHQNSNRFAALKEEDEDAEMADRRTAQSRRSDSSISDIQRSGSGLSDIPSYPETRASNIPSVHDHRDSSSVLSRPASTRNDDDFGSTKGSSADGVTSSKILPKVREDRVQERVQELLQKVAPMTNFHIPTSTPNTQPEMLLFTSDEHGTYEIGTFDRSRAELASYILFTSRTPGSPTIGLVLTDTGCTHNPIPESVYNRVKHMSSTGKMLLEEEIRFGTAANDREDQDAPVARYFDILYFRINGCADLFVAKFVIVDGGSIATFPLILGLPFMRQYGVDISMKTDPAELKIGSDAFQCAKQPLPMVEIEFVNEHVTVGRYPVYDAASAMMINDRFAADNNSTDEGENCESSRDSSASRDASVEKGQSLLLFTTPSPPLKWKPKRAATEVRLSVAQILYNSNVDLLENEAFLEEVDSIIGEDDADGANAVPENAAPANETEEERKERLRKQALRAFMERERRSLGHSKSAEMLYEGEALEVLKQVRASCRLCGMYDDAHAIRTRGALLQFAVDRNMIWIMDVVPTKIGMLVKCMDACSRFRHAEICDAHEAYGGKVGAAVRCFHKGKRLMGGEPEKLIVDLGSELVSRRFRLTVGATNTDIKIVGFKAAHKISKLEQDNGQTRLHISKLVSPPFEPWLEILLWNYAHHSEDQEFFEFDHASLLDVCLKIKANVYDYPAETEMKQLLLEEYLWQTNNKPILGTCLSAQNLHTGSFNRGTRDWEFLLEETLEWDTGTKSDADIHMQRVAKIQNACREVVAQRDLELYARRRELVSRMYRRGRKLRLEPGEEEPTLSKSFPIGTRVQIRRPETSKIHKWVEGEVQGTDEATQTVLVEHNGRAQRYNVTDVAVEKPADEGSYVAEFYPDQDLLDLVCDRGATVVFDDEEDETAQNDPDVLHVPRRDLFYKLKDGVSTHKPKSLGGDLGGHVCEHCSERFTSRHRLLQHMNTTCKSYDDAPQREVLRDAAGMQLRNPAIMPRNHPFPIDGGFKDVVKWAKEEDLAQVKWRGRVFDEHGDGVWRLRDEEVDEDESSFLEPIFYGDAELDGGAAFLPVGERLFKDGILNEKVRREVEKYKTGVELSIGDGEIFITSSAETPDADIVRAYDFSVLTAAEKVLAKSSQQTQVFRLLRGPNKLCFSFSQLLNGRCIRGDLNAKNNKDIQFVVVEAQAHREKISGRVDPGRHCNLRFGAGCSPSFVDDEAAKELVENTWVVRLYYEVCADAHEALDLHTEGAKSTAITTDLKTAEKLGFQSYAYPACVAEVRAVSDSGVLGKRYKKAELKRLGKHNIVTSRWLLVIKVERVSGKFVRVKARWTMHGFKDLRYRRGAGQEPNRRSYTIGDAALVALVQFLQAIQVPPSLGDIKEAFLRGMLFTEMYEDIEDQEAFLEIPEAIVEMEIPGVEALDECVQQVKSLYGNKDAPMGWEKKWWKVCRIAGLQQAVSDPSLWLYYANAAEQRAIDDGKEIEHFKTKMAAISAVPPSALEQRVRVLELGSVPLVPDLTRLKSNVNVVNPRTLVLNEQVLPHVQRRDDPLGALGMHVDDSISGGKLLLHLRTAIVFQHFELGSFTTLGPGQRENYVGRELMVVPMVFDQWQLRQHLSANAVRVADSGFVPADGAIDQPTEDELAAAEQVTGLRRDTPVSECPMSESVAFDPMWYISNNHLSMPVVYYLSQTAYASRLNQLSDSEVRTYFAKKRVTTNFWAKKELKSPIKGKLGELIWLQKCNGVICEEVSRLAGEAHIAEECSTPEEIDLFLGRLNNIILIAQLPETNTRRVYYLAGLRKHHLASGGDAGMERIGGTSFLAAVAVMRTTHLSMHHGKPKRIFHSSTGIELLSQRVLSSESVFLSQILFDLSLTQISRPILQISDAKNCTSEPSERNLKPDHYSIAMLIREGFLVVKHGPGTDMWADGFTKIMRLANVYLLHMAVSWGLLTARMTKIVQEHISLAEKREADRAAHVQELLQGTEQEADFEKWLQSAADEDDEDEEEGE
eukprot:g19175.t1